MMKKRILVVLAAVSLLFAGGTAAYAATTSLQSGGYADHVLVDQYSNGGSNVGPGGIGDSISCPEGYFATGGGYDFSAATTPTIGFRASFDGPVSGWGGIDTAWSVAGSTDVAGTFRIWASCLKLS
jgi:hypothetical protein